MNSIYNFQKAKKYYQLNLRLVVLSFLITMLIGLFETKNYFTDLLTVLPLLVTFITVPLGLYYTIISYKNNEGNKVILIRYFLVELILILLYIGLILSLIKDISKISN